MEERENEAADQPADQPAVQPEAGPEEGSDERAQRRSARFNVRWIAAGAAVLCALITFGQFIITRNVIAQDPELSRTFAALQEHEDQARSTADPSDDELSDERKEEYRAVLFGSTGLLLGLAMILFLAPILVGVLVSRFSGLAKDGALAVTAGILIAGIATGAVVESLVSLPFYFGMGLLAGLLGRKLSRGAAG